MKEKTKLKVYQYTPKNNIPNHKKTLSLPAYLYKQDDFAMFIARHCGCHTFHINYTDSEKMTRRLCDIKINRISHKDVSYTIPITEDIMRLSLLLKRNRKTRHLMKETTTTGKNTPQQPRKVLISTRTETESMYG